MFCEHCGTEVSENSNFCLKCGRPTNEQPNNEPIPINQPIKPNKKENKNSFSKIVLSVLLTIMIFLSSFATLLLFTARDCIKPKQVSNILDNVDVEKFVEHSDFEISENINSKKIEKIYEKTTFKDYIEDTVTDYSDYLLGGKKPKGIDYEDIGALVLENRFEIEEIIGGELSLSADNEIYDFFKKNGEENLGVFSSEVRTNDTLDAIRAAISVFVVVTMLILTILFAFLLLKARSNSVDFLLWVSVPLILTALLVGLAPMIMTIILSSLGNLNPLVSEVVSLITDNISGVVLLNSGLVLITGILLIVAFTLTKKIKK